MARWVLAGLIDDCPPGSGLELVLDGRLVALFNVEGEFCALDGVCPHQGGPLGKGQLCGSVLTCPWHGWQFDVRSGQHQLNARLTQPRFPARTEGDEVWIDMA